MRTMFRMGLVAGLILAGLAVSDARAQQPVAPGATRIPGQRRRQRLGRV